MFAAEGRHWWYWGLRDLVVPLARGEAGAGAAAGGGVTGLDAGRGTGANLEALALAGVRAFGLERAAEAFPFLKARGVTRAARGSVVHLPFADRTFDLVLSTDVLCCVGPPGDLAAARELARVLKPGGR